jgi:Fe-S-cluster-containing hydrogenase component 2
MACPFGNITLSPDNHKAIKCELCDGDPQCVRFCVTGALQYRESEEQVADKTAAFAERLKEVYRQLETIGKGVYIRT